MGQRARPHTWWTPVRVVLAAFTVVFALGLVQKYPCGETHWSDNDVRYSKMCYSDVPYLYTDRGFAAAALALRRLRRPLQGDGVPGPDLLLRVGRLEDHRPGAVGSVAAGAGGDARSSACGGSRGWHGR